MTMRKITRNNRYMKGLMLAAACAMMPFSGYSQRYLTEDFDYNVGDLYQQGPWVKYGAGTSENDLNVGEGSLTYEGYSTKTTGNCALIANKTNCYSLQAPIRGTAISKGALYMSALINVQKAADGKAFLQFVRANGGTVSDGGYGMGGGRFVLSAGSTDNTFKIGICRVNLREAVYAPDEYELNKTYLVVIKYEFVEGEKNDPISLWVNPTDFQTEPEPVASSTFTSQDLPDIIGIALTQNSMRRDEWNDMKVDAIHVAGSWADLFKEETPSVETGMKQLPNRNIVLLENFTNTGCGPCAKFAPVLDKVINERLGDAICLKVHGCYPSADDPFYVAEKANIDERLSFYDIHSYPTLVLNGTQQNYTLSTTILNAWIDYLMKEQRDYDINISSTVADHQLTVSGDVTALTDVADASNLRLTAVAIEEYYKSPTAYSNGEKEMEYVAKRFMPDGNGWAIGASMEKDKKYEFNFSCDLNSFYDESELGVVAYLQDISTKKILATAYIPKKAKNEDYANLLKVTDTPDFICVPDFYGKVIFRNDGINNLKSAKVNVEVNGVLHTYDWTGDLTRFEKDTVAVSDIKDFALSTDGSKNNVKVWLTNVNGTETESEPINLTFSNSMQATGAVRLRIYTDKKPQETTWKVFNSAGDVVLQGGPYTEARHKYTEDFKLNTDDCYSLVIYDAGGDGINSAMYGAGYYQFYQLNGKDASSQTTLLTQGTFENAECDIAFNLKDADETLGINEVKASTDAKSSITIFDESGKVLLKTTVGKLTDADMLSVGKGAKIVRIDDGKHVYVSKHIINK